MEKIERAKYNMTQSKMIFIGQKELYNVFSNYSPDLLDFQKYNDKTSSLARSS